MTATVVRLTTDALATTLRLAGAVPDAAQELATALARTSRGGRLMLTTLDVHKTWIVLQREALASADACPDDGEPHQVA